MKNLAELTLKKDLDVRFIELMPVGQGRKFTGIKNEEIYNLLQNLFQFQDEYFEIKGVTKYYKLKKA